MDGDDGPMKLQEITATTGSRIFHDVARSVYAGDPNWIAPLDLEVEAVFDPKKNSSFEHGEAIRWILRDAAGRGVGRVAAFVDFEKAKRKDPAEGGVGFFECPDDPAAAELVERGRLPETLGRLPLRQVEARKSSKRGALHEECRRVRDRIGGQLFLERRILIKHGPALSVRLAAGNALRRDRTFQVHQPAAVPDERKEALAHGGIAHGKMRGIIEADGVELLQRGRAVHGRGGEQPQLAADAALVPVPRSVELRPRHEFRYIGTRVARVDVPEKISGSARFGIDVGLPGLATAVLVRSHEFGARLARECASLYGEDLWTCAVDEAGASGAVVIARD